MKASRKSCSNLHQWDGDSLRIELMLLLMAAPWLEGKPLPHLEVGFFFFLPRVQIPCHGQKWMVKSLAMMG